MLTFCEVLARCSAHLNQKTTETDLLNHLVRLMAVDWCDAKQSLQTGKQNETLGTVSDLVRIYSDPPFFFAVSTSSREYL